MHRKLLRCLLVVLCIGCTDTARQAEVVDTEGQLQGVIQEKNDITEKELRGHIEFLASDALRGRGTNDGGYIRPAEFLVSEFKRYGILPLGDVVEGERLYTQEFPYHTTTRKGRTVTEIKARPRNVIGWIPGENINEVVLIGAHYDHLGVGTDGAIYYGADDNASGTAAVLEIAQSYAELSRRKQLKRSVVCCFWAAEEEGLLGSAHFTRNPPKEVPLANIITVVNLDMVGRNNDKQLLLITTPQKADFRKVCSVLHGINAQVNALPEFQFAFEYSNDGFNASDSYSFFVMSPSIDRTPILFYSTGLHRDYHAPTDTADRINYPKLTRVARFTFCVSYCVAELHERPRYKPQ